MKKFVTFVLSIFITSTLLQAQETDTLVQATVPDTLIQVQAADTIVYLQDLDSVLSKHFDAIGMDVLLTCQTMTMTGKSMQMGMETTFTIYFKRPGKFRLEVDVQGQKLIQAYDGQKGWMIAPWSGTSDPIDVPPDQMKFMRWQADMDGMLYNWKEKGYVTELIGHEDMEGTMVYKIKQTLPDGDVFHYYVDAENFIILKTEMDAIFQSNELNEQTLNSNFKEVNGMILPFNTESSSQGTVTRQVVVDKYDFSVSVDDSLFTMPEKQVQESAPKEQK